ncbi:MAG: nicotinate (nicotinamide) nucleotide adenylyltransferase [Oscillospiraceae bacterium]|nr:nicotinate (nicotinamide) nucleotide adenylyltransferase [Oscillospiraceae bacterium]
MKIGIYGGTFNPPHIGHIKAARSAIKALGLDKLIVIPANIPPHKELPAFSPAAAQRYEMAVLAFGDVEKAEVSDIEVSRDGLSYTCDTLKKIKRSYPGSEIFLVMGTDMFASLDRWYNFNYILENSTLSPLARSEGDIAVINAKAEELRASYNAGISVIGLEPVSVSSTEIRSELTHRLGRDYLSDSVYAYIIKNRLYGALVDFEWLRVQAYQMLNLKRIPHVAGCEAEAVKLARRWGVDADEARHAAILHDITKKCGFDEQLLLCRKYDIVTDITEKSEYKLLHSKTGAAIAQSDFGASDDVTEAISWHTTGKADMSLLEKIIYLADYIEPTRDFEGLTELRTLAYEDIDAALKLGLMMSIEDMRGRGIVPHYRSTEAIKWLERTGEKD